jgi:hypothetical protein
VEIIKDYILAVMRRCDIGSDESVLLLREYLDEDAELFVHELIGFARSPFDIRTYDDRVQYSNDQTDDNVQQT